MYAVEMTSGGMIYIHTFDIFMKIGTAIEAVLRFCVRR
jgi:hypothetical protein